MVGKQKSSTRALRIHNSSLECNAWTLPLTNITLESLNFWLIKMAKEQSLILSNGKFTACVILKEH